MGTGSVAANFHEGSRSEYLAQYVFASFGTAIAVPHQEDSGIDLHCTLTERVGQRAWVRGYFSAQVKSDDAAWVFAGIESVRWLLEHPTPLFLCVVDKKELRLRVYQTSPRFLAQLESPRPERVVLEPACGAEDAAAVRTNPGAYSLGVPIIDYTVRELLDERIAQRARECLCAWSEIDRENIRRRATGMFAVVVPSRHETNEVPSGNPREGDGTSTMMGPPTAETFSKLTELLHHIGTYSRGAQSATTGAVVNMLHRQLTKAGARMVIPFVNEELNASMLKTGAIPAAPYLFAGVDRLLEAVRAAVEP